MTEHGPVRYQYGLMVEELHGLAVAWRNTPSPGLSLELRDAADAIDVLAQNVDILRGVMNEAIGMLSGYNLAPCREETVRYCRERMLAALNATKP